MNVTIRPLEWGTVYDSGMRATATACGVAQWALFEVVSCDPARSVWNWYYGTDGDFSYFPDGSAYGSAEQAMAAAELWHAGKVSEWLTADG